jgi:hypothetical protein
MPTERYALAGQYKIRFKPRAPGAVLDYSIDFGAMVADIAPTTLLSVAWSVVAVPGDPKPLTVVSQSLAANVSVVRLTAGNPLSEYSVRVQCSWSDGETTVVSFALPIDFLPNAGALFPIGVPSAEIFGLPTIH